MRYENLFIHGHNVDIEPTNSKEVDDARSISTLS